MRNGVVDGAAGARLTWMVPMSSPWRSSTVMDLDAAAEGGDDVEQGGAGGVHAERVEDEVGVGEEKSGAEEECGGGDVSGDGGVDGVEALAAGDGERGGLVEAAGERAGEGGAEGEQCVLGVVAGEDGFGEAGDAFGL